MRKILGASLLCLATCAPAAQLKLIDDYVEVSGVLENSDRNELPKIFDNKKIKGVVFKDCLGGSAATSTDFRLHIQLNGLWTKASGTVASACALAFLAAEDRSFAEHNSNARKNRLVLHGVYSLNGDLISEHAIADYLVKRTGGKIDKDFSALIVGIPNKDGGLHVTEKPFVKDDVEYFAKFCDQRLRTDCVFLKDMNAKSLGLITR